ncbi:MAG TPA: ABC transporter permease [Mycobacteriales bacterium]|nr:ABC transporter permease [Mycobacteriales bacterium]
MTTLQMDAPPARSATSQLIRTEVLLRLRDPLTLTFAFAFPILTMLIIGGSFGTEPDPVFEGQNPAHWYVASYLTVMIGATGLVTMPVHLASYRERGVLRRFAVAGFPRWSFALAQLAVGLATVVLAGALLLAVAAPVYGIPTVQDPVRVGLGLAAGAVAFVSLGVLLGTVLRSARAAQAVGLILFFPSFLLGVGGPPPEVMGSALRALSQFLPLAVVTDAVRQPWLGIGDGTGPLIATVAMAAVALVVAARRTAL